MLILTFYVSEGDHGAIQGRTGNMDCTTSLTNPPKKKHTTAVNMMLAWRQNQIRLASLEKYVLRIGTSLEGNGECALLDVENEVEHCRGNAEASEVEKLVV